MAERICHLRPRRETGRTWIYGVFRNEKGGRRGDRLDFSPIESA
jgi:hypothetical protein